MSREPENFDFCRRTEFSHPTGHSPSRPPKRATAVSPDRRRCTTARLLQPLQRAGLAAQPELFRLLLLRRAGAVARAGVRIVLGKLAVNGATEVGLARLAEIAHVAWHRPLLSLACAERSARSRRATAAAAATLRRVIVQARRYAQAVRGDLRNGGSLPQWRRVTGRSMEHVERLAHGGYGYLTPEHAGRIEQALPRPLADWLRESPRYPCNRGEIPAAVVQPILEQAVGRYGSDVAAAQALKINPRHLLQIRKQQAVSFPVADRIVTRTLGAQAWVNNPTLRRWYFESAVF